MSTPGIRFGEAMVVVFKVSIITIGTLLLLSMIFTIADHISSKGIKCIEEYGGKYKLSGYCIYIEDGNSKSIKLNDILEDEAE